MKKLLLALLFTSAAFAQTVVQAKGFDTVSTTSSDVLTFTLPTTNGNAILCYTRSNKSCANNVANGAATSWTLTDNASPPNMYTGIVPNTGGYLVGITGVTGSGYFSPPTVAVSGCSSNGTYAAATSGSSPSITVAGVTVTTLASGCGPTLPTIAYSGGTPITGTTASAVATTVGVEATQCAVAFLAYNITGAASHAITYTHVSSDYHGLTCAEVNLGTTTNPLDAVARAVNTSSVSSVTSDAFTTAQANEIAFMGVTQENTSNTWTAASGYTIAANSAGTSSGLISLQYKVFTGIQSGVTQVSQVSNHTGAMSAMLVTLKGSTGASTSHYPPVIIGSLWSPGLRMPAILSPPTAWSMISSFLQAPRRLSSLKLF